MKKQGQLPQNGKRSFPVAQFICMLLMLCMVFTLLPKTALAGEDGYSYDAETKVLTITTNAEATNSAAWKQDATGIKANVTAIIVADTVTTIGMNAFYNCPQLTSVAIGKNVVNMDIGAFNTAPKLSTLTVAAENTAYKAVNNVLFSNDGTKLVRYPEGLTNTSYTVPDGVKTIYTNAFYKNAYITDISLPDSVTELGYQAFFYCTKLSSMNIPATVTKLGDSVFSNTALTSIAIPAGVTEIPFNAFLGCTELTSVAIGEGVTSIHNNAFSMCPKLNTFTVAAGSSSYKAVENVLLTKDGKTLVKYPNGLTALSYTVPDGVETIGSRAFYENPCLTTVIFANSVTEIAREAFYGCTELTTVDLGESLHTIGNSAFSSCSKLSSADLPATVTTIGNNAFYTTKLSAITIPAGVTSIEDYAFYSTSLVTVTIPAAVTSIGDYAFAYCLKLKTVIMDSDTAPTIGEKVFYSSNNAIIYTSIGATGYDAANWPSGKVVEGRAWLSALSLSGITLSPDFATGTTSYTASVGNSVGSTTVTPTMAAGTGITVNSTAVASGSTSNAILLNGGDNTITVVVANSSYPAETKTYTITVTKLTPNPKPTATFTAIGADSGILTNVTTAMKYSVDGGATWLSITEPPMNIINVTALNGVQIKEPGNNTTTADSEVQTIAVTKAEAPVGVGKTDETSSLHNGTITGVSNLMEYKESSATSYTVITGSTVTGLDGGTYLVRVKATGTTLASTPVSLTITAFTKGTSTALDLNYSLATVTFNGSAKPLSVTKKTAGIGDITVKYAGSTTAPTNAGTYAITVDISGNAEYNAVTGLSLGNYTIAKAADPAVANNAASVTFNDTAAKTHMLVGLPTNMGTTTFAKGSVSDIGSVLQSSSVASANGEVSYQLAAGLTSADANKTATIPVTVTSENYEEFTVNLVITVANKTDVSSSITFANNSATYNGSVQTHEAASTTDTTGGSFTYTYSTGDGVLEGGEPKGAGTYTVTASYESDTVMGSKTATFTINKKAATVNVSLSSSSITVGDALPTPSLSYGGLVSGENLTTVETAVFAGMPSNSNTAGTYAINWDNAVAMKVAIEALPAAANYSITYTESVNLVIHAKSSGGGKGNTPVNNNVIIITPPTAAEPEKPTQGEIKVSGTVDGKGNATVNITEKTITDVFDKALANAKQNGNEQNGITLVLKVETEGKSVSNVAVNLPKSVQDNIIAKEIVNTIVVVDNPNIKIGMDLVTVKEINQQAKADVDITATRTDSANLNTAAQKAIGSRPIFNLNVNYGGGNQVQNFGAGNVSVTIPYTLAANEKAENVCAVYVDANGTVHWLTDSVYDSVNQVVRFNTNHFSMYGVGYREDAPAFTDTANHWAKEDIAFVVSRELFSGTSETTFSPNTAMTRAMFITVLGRLANADVSNYKESSFSDVKNDAYYMGYIEWASKNGIINGTGNEKFAPNQAITREQMTVIMSNYVKTMNLKLPQSNTENSFTDSAKISTYAKDAVKQMQLAGVINGKSGNRFDAQGTATRAEVSAVLHRFVELATAADTI